mmetsp:Transcript_39005/g.62492  ORF Transcript_39005/g.62492 Transcript_39005/m.62492 type:complete len:133 (+) Transcript_39005:97-495(+)
MGGGISGPGKAKKSAKPTAPPPVEDSKDRGAVVEIEFKPEILGLCIKGWTVFKVFLKGQGHKLGVQPKWRILAINGQEVENNSHNIKRILAGLIQQKLKVKISFGTKEDEIEATDVAEIAFDLDEGGELEEM